MDEEKVKLLHEIELLRGRMIRMLDDHANMLTTATQAMRRGKTAVAIERVEFVVDSMTIELAKLRGEL